MSATEQKAKKLLRPKRFLAAAALVLVIGYLLPERAHIPVANAGVRDWNSQSFWYFPWGKSGVHKGIDIFARKGTRVRSSVDAFVLYQGEIELGGKVVFALGPRWKIHYYAHLDAIDVRALTVIKAGEAIATVGDSGNAKGKPPHLHYAILRLIPIPWQIDFKAPQGYKKAFYQDPNELLK
jgi:peptidoglycan LD-endopeptidase LytH